MPKIEWLALKANQEQQAAKQRGHASSGALKERKLSFCPGIHSTQTHTHTMQVSARQQPVSAWKGSLLLGTFSGFLNTVAFLRIPSPFWSLWKKIKSLEPRLPHLLGPRKLEQLRAGIYCMILCFLSNEKELLFLSKQQ